MLFRLFLALLVTTTSAVAALNVQVKAKAAILINADTGAVLYEKDARGEYYPASITKIATAAYFLKKQGDALDVPVTATQDLVGWASPDKKKRANYTLPAYWLEPGASHVGIKVGERVPLRDLLYGMLVASADECANMLAFHGGNGSVDTFMKELNAFLKNEIGCTKTHFCNPHGLFHPEHKTTAYDMALIARAAMKNPLFRKIVSTTEYRRQSTGAETPMAIVQTNRLLKPGKYYYPKAIGIKTGYIAKAKHNLVAAAKDGNRTLIAVLLGVEERGEIYQDAVNLFEAAFQEKKVTKCFLPKGHKTFSTKLNGAARTLTTYTKQDVTMTYYEGEEAALQGARCFLKWEPLQVPVPAHQKVGSLDIVSAKGDVLVSTDLFAECDVPEAWYARLSKKFKSHSSLSHGAVAVAGLAFVGGAAAVFRRKQK